MSFHHPSRLERAALLVALGSLVAACARCVSRTHTRRLAGRSAALAHHDQSWEGEGGRPLDDDYDPPDSPDSPSPAVPAP